MQSKTRSAVLGANVANAICSEYTSSGSPPGAPAALPARKCGLGGKGGKFFAGLLHNSHVGTPPRPSSFTRAHFWAQSLCRSAKSPRQLHPREIARPEAKSSGASVSRQIKHVGVEVVRAAVDPVGEPCISPVSISRAPRLPLRSEITGIVAAESVPESVLALGEFGEDDVVSSLSAGCERQGNFQLKKDRALSLIDGSSEAEAP